MSDSVKSSRTDGASARPASSSVRSEGVFFGAGDYTEANTPSAELVMTRSRVARHRSKLKAKVALQLEDLARINAGLHAADRVGNAVEHWDSAVALVGRLAETVRELASVMEKAEIRHAEACFVAAGPAAALKPKPGQQPGPVAVAAESSSAMFSRGGVG